jgi:VWFA-related protein
MHPWTNVSLAVASALFALTTTAATPTNQGPHLGETIDVSIVNVDAIVTDKQGNRVRGLTRDDFVILESGKPQAITNFADYAGGQAISPDQDRPERLSSITQPRSIIVFVEHFRAPDFRREPFFTGLREFLHRIVRPGDSVKVVSYYEGIETRQDFTDKLPLVDTALAAIDDDSRPGIDPVELQEKMLKETFTASSGRGRSWGDGQGLLRSPFADVPTMQQMSAPAQVNLPFMRMQHKIAAITSLMNSMAGADAKKVFVMAVRNFAPSNPLRDLDTVRGGGFMPSYGWSSRFRSDAMIDYVSKTANANAITVYSLMPLGLATDGFGPDDAFVDYVMLNAQLPYLDEVAKNTGGKLVWGADIKKDLPPLADDLDSYYSLGYRATTSRVDRARSIAVKTKNPAYVVRSRREYVEKSDATRMRDRVIANLFDQPAASSMNVTVETARPRASGSDASRYSIPVTVHIPVVGLMTDGGRGQFSVYVGWSGADGAIGEVIKKTQKFTLKADMPETFEYTFDLLIDRDTSRVSVGVFDEVSKDYGLKRIDLDDVRKIAEAR